VCVIGQIVAAEPVVRQAQIPIFPHPPLSPDAAAKANRQHADPQFRINGRIPRLAMEACKIGTNTARVDEPANGSQQAVLRHGNLAQEVLRQELQRDLPPTRQSRIALPRNKESLVQAGTSGYSNEKYCANLTL
jgi:hypothetical protein